MGLSSKQATGDGLHWTHNLLLPNQGLELPKPPQARQDQQQQQQKLRCPRCDSTNTKFCYYNNYNRSQPRHFCKACRRHWTKGGSLRNVPVGGGRKNNKRQKTTDTSTTHHQTHINIAPIQQQQFPLPAALAAHRDEDTSGLPHPSLLPPYPQPSQVDFISSNQDSSSVILQFPLLNSSLDKDPSPNLFSYTRDAASLFDATKDNDHFSQFSTQLSSSATPWTNNITTSFIDSAYWNLDDLAVFVSPDVRHPPQEN